MTIKLADAAKFDSELPHQVEAWNWLQGTLSPDTLETFASKYRTAPTTAEDYANTWDGVIKASKKAGVKYPEVVAAQWALESGWGKHTSGKNNYFGLKGSGTSTSTQEFINGHCSFY